MAELRAKYPDSITPEPSPIARSQTDVVRRARENLQARRVGLTEPHPSPAPIIPIPRGGPDQAEASLPDHVQGAHVFASEALRRRLEARLIQEAGLRAFDPAAAAEAPRGLAATRRNGFEQVRRAKAARRQAVIQSLRNRDQGAHQRVQSLRAARRPGAAGVAARSRQMSAYDAWLGLVPQFDAVQPPVVTAGPQFFNAPPTITAHQQYLADKVGYFSDGGPVPQGTDSQPAMLSPGEFVVNRHAAQANASQLSSINSGGRLGSNANGGGGGDMVKSLQQSFAAFKAPVDQLRQSFKGFDDSTRRLEGFSASAQLLSQAMAPFAAAAERLGKALAATSIPSSIDVKLNSRIDVSIVGTSAIAALKGDIAREVAAAVMAQLPSQIRQSIENMPVKA
jgi:hypothetical protein